MKIEWSTPWRDRLVGILMLVIFLIPLAIIHLSS